MQIPSEDEIRETREILYAAIVGGASLLFVAAASLIAYIMQSSFLIPYIRLPELLAMQHDWKTGQQIAAQGLKNGCSETICGSFATGENALQLNGAAPEPAWKNLGINMMIAMQAFFVGAVLTIFFRQYGRGLRLNANRNSMMAASLSLISLLMGVFGYFLSIANKGVILQHFIPSVTSAASVQLSDIVSRTATNAGCAHAVAAACGNATDAPTLPILLGSAEMNSPRIPLNITVAMESLPKFFGDTCSWQQSGFVLLGASAGLALVVYLVYLLNRRCRNNSDQGRSLERGGPAP